MYPDVFIKSLDARRGHPLSDSPQAQLIATDYHICCYETDTQASDRTSFIPTGYFIYSCQVIVPQLPKRPAPIPIYPFILPKNLSLVSPCFRVIVILPHAPPCPVPIPGPYWVPVEVIHAFLMVMLPHAAPSREPIPAGVSPFAFAITVQSSILICQPPVVLYIVPIPHPKRPPIAVNFPEPTILILPLVPLFPN